MLDIARGIVLVITNAKSIQGLPDGFQEIANGTILGIPNLLIMFVIITAIAWFVLTRTGFGRYVYSVGSNPEAACVIGGASLSGARGSAIGAACGALIIGVLNNGGNLLATNAFYLQIAIGALILVAVGFDQMNTRNAARG